MNRQAFFDHIREALFKGRLNDVQVVGMECVLTAWQAHGDGNATRLAYVLATAYHETGGRMVPVREGFAESDASARKIVRRRKYGKPTGPHNHVYYGRGHVQLTWHANYVESSKDAGVDLEKYPDNMLDPLISARVLVRGMLDGRWNGTGKGLGAYLNNKRRDYRNARRTVNVTDKWQLIKEYALAFEAALRVAAYAEPAPPITAPRKKPPDPAHVETALRKDGSRTIRATDLQENIGTWTGVATGASALVAAVTEGIENIMASPTFMLLAGLAVGAGALLFYQGVLAKHIRGFRVEDQIAGFKESRSKAVATLNGEGDGESGT